jgi:hypothetical protein
MKSLETFSNLCDFHQKIHGLRYGFQNLQYRKPKGFLFFVISISVYAYPYRRHGGGVRLVDEGGGALEKVLALARHQLGQVLALCWAQPWQLAVPTTQRKRVNYCRKQWQLAVPTPSKKPVSFSRKQCKNPSVLKVLVLRIRIRRIHMLLGLPNLDPLVRSTDTDMKKSLKKGVRSGSISQRYESDDPGPHQYVTDLPKLFPSK